MHPIIILAKYVLFKCKKIRNFNNKVADYALFM